MKFTLILALLVFASACSRTHSDPQTADLAGGLTKAMGGLEAFEAPRYLLFRFVAEHTGETLADYSHAWDRWTGSYRVSGKSREGMFFVALFNVDDPTQGTAWLDGRKLEGDDLTLMLEKAYQRHINDAYWLMMPWKWEDPGVHLRLEASQTLNGKMYDVVKLTFMDGTGLTSGDTYWGYLSKETHLMEYWSFVLQDSQSTEPLLWSWEEWEDAGHGVLFSKRKYNQERDLAIIFPEARLADSVPKDLFTNP